MQGLLLIWRGNGTYFNPIVAGIKGKQQMSQSQKPAGRKPATKFANLRKKMDQGKLRTKMNNLRVRKSGNR